MKSEAQIPGRFGDAEPAGVLDQNTLNSLAHKGSIIRLKLGEELVPADDQSIYALLTGGIRLLSGNREGQAKRTTLILSSTGQTFGQMTMLSEQSEGETARSTGDTTVVKLTKEIVENAAGGSSELRDNLLKWELVRLAAIGLSKLPEAVETNAKLLGRFLGAGSIMIINEGETRVVSSIEPDCTVLLCEGEIQIDETSVRSASPDAQLSARLIDKPCRIKGLKKSVIFIGSKQILSSFKEIKGDSQYEKEFSLNAIPLQEAAAAQKSEDAPEYQCDRITWLKKKFRQYPLVVQQSAMDCGVACLSMVSAFHGKSVPMNRLRELAKVTNQGTDLKSLSDAAETLGFLTKGIRANFEGLQKLQLPLICHWGSNHYVVLFEIDQTGVLIGDPADDLVKLDKSKFLQRYSGYCLELVPTGNLSVKEKSIHPFGRYAALLTKHKRSLIDIALASTLIQLLMLAMPLFTQVVVDKVLIHQSLSMLNILLLGMVFLNVFQTVVSGLRSYFMAFSAMKLDQSLFVQFYKHVLSLPLSFFEERTQGDVMTRFGENRKIRELMSGSTLTTLIDVLMALIYLLIIFIYNFWFGVFTTGYVIVFALIATVTAPVLRTIRRRAFQKDIASNSFLMESLRGIEKIKSAASENRTRWAWETKFVDSLNVNFKGTLVARGTQLVSELVHISGNVLLLWFGAHLVIQGTISIGQLMALNLMVARITEPILHVVDVWDDLQDVVVALERLNDVLDQKPEEEALDNKIVLPPMSGDFHFESVTFRYPGNVSENALQNVSFTIKPGTMVGVVGRSGCGKSTLLKLMQGLYLPTSGRIFVDDHDISHVSLASLRTQVGVVAQNDYLFRGSIKEAIAYYKPEASMEEVVSAAKLAGIHDFISTLTRGYNYELTEGGGNLSGGQRQRLAIARAIVHSPKLLLFDEATSFLDSESEQAIQNSIAELRGGRSLVVVAHRLSTIRDADTIIVMDRGQIVESGNHASLIAQKGLYFYLCQKQTID